MADGYRIVYINNGKVNALAGEPSNEAHLYHHLLTDKEAQTIKRDDISRYGFSPDAVMIIPNDAMVNLGQQVEVLVSRMKR